MLRDVVALLGTEIHAFELGVVCEVFGLDRSEEGLPCFDFAVCSSHPGSLRATGGMTIHTPHGLDRARSADLLVIPAWHTRDEPPDPGIRDVLHAAVDRQATVLSVCSGAFLLAATGLLTHRRATCHWYHADHLRERHPSIALEPDRLYVEDGPIVTSAGTAAGIDACLYLVRRELGAHVANAIARRMVVPPHRDGGQAQYVETPVPPRSETSDDLAGLLEWLQAHLDQTQSVAELSDRVHMSPRTFARRFLATTGTSPHRWITRQRVILAQRLLEEDTLSVEEIAHRSGFSTAEVLRHHFTQQISTTPSAYRRTFSHQLVGT